MNLRIGFRDYYKKCLLEHAELASKEDDSASAMIFAPHQDDETLGLGGTISRKCAAGAHVRIIFLTDGSQSHPAHQNAISPQELSKIRSLEALKAAQVLGVEKSKVDFLGYPDTQMASHLGSAAQKIVVMLEDYQPQQVFIPIYRDGNGDHGASRAAVRIALQQFDRAVTVFQYPIWLWNRWPFVKFSYQQFKTSAKDLLAHGAPALGAWRSLLKLNYAFEVQDHLETKHLALDQYQTQVSRYNAEANWPILSDVSGGDWLDCFFWRIELFYKSKWEKMIDEGTLNGMISKQI